MQMQNWLFNLATIWKVHKRLLCVNSNAVCFFVNQQRGKGHIFIHSGCTTQETVYAASLFPCLPLKQQFQIILDEPVTCTRGERSIFHNSSAL